MTAEMEKQIRALRADNKSVREMCEATGKSKSTIARYLMELGLSKPTARTDIKDEDVLAAWDSGFTIVEIADRFSCSHDTVTKRLAKHGITCDRVSGIKRHFERTHEAMWEDIKADLDKKIALGVIAKKYSFRYDNIVRLMETHDYPYRRRDLTAMSMWDEKYMSAVKTNRPHELELLWGIQEYVEKYDGFPTILALSEVTGMSRAQVSQLTKKYDLGLFVERSHGKTSGHVIRLMNEFDALSIKYDINNQGILKSEDGGRLEMDFYIPELKLGLEVNPTGTHSIDVLKYGVKTADYHQKKALAAERAGVGLLHLYDIDFYDFENYRRIIRQVSLRLQPRVKLGARLCEVREIYASVACDFLEDYHFQGMETGSSFRYGLFYGDVLVAVLCVGRPRYSGNYDYEIIRYCTHPGYIVSGCFGKLFKHFLRCVGVRGTVVSYMDLNKRFSAENVYEKNGFVLDGITQPDYWWAKKHGIPVLKRYETTKAKLVAQGFDADKTEVEIMRSRGYFRVFGAGSKRYVYYID